MKLLQKEQFLAKRIPSPASFRAARELFESEAVLPFLGTGVIGAFAYGSSTRDDCTPASDIDYLMVVEDGGMFPVVRSATRHVWDDFSIHLQARVIKRDFAENGWHGIEASFREHLDLSVRMYGHHGENPLDLLTQRGQPLDDALREASALYVKKLSDGYVNYPTNEAEHLEFLEAVLSKPWHAMRVGLQAAHGTAAPGGLEYFSDSKSYLMELFSCLDMAAGLRPDIDAVRNAARSYVTVLENMREASLPCSVALKAYDLSLRRIEDAHPCALRIAETVARNVDKAIEDRPR